MLAHLDARDVGGNWLERAARFLGSVWLYVKRVHVLWSATQPHQYDRAIRRASLEGSMGRTLFRQGLQSEDISQSQSKHAKRTNSDEVSASEQSRWSLTAITFRDHDESPH